MVRKCLVFAVIFLLSSLHVFAIPPSPAGGNTLDLSGGKHGYYYAEDINNSFDGKFVKGAFTIEFWFCPARLPNFGEGWNIVGKLPVYQIELAYRGDLEKEWASTRYVINQAMYRSYNIWDSSSKENYKPEWHHFVVQGNIYESGDNTLTFLDGISNGQSGSSGGGGTITDSDDPFCVGGFPAGTKTIIWIGDRQTIEADLTTFDGLIDELRISKTIRYEPKFPDETIDVPKRFEPDKYTVALWHFDEGANQPYYEDASGNGHTLLASGFDNITGVNQRQMLPILWGNIKR